MTSFDQRIDTSSGARRAVRHASALAAALLATSALTPVALGQTLPTGGTFVAGAGTISTSGPGMTVNQTTSNAVIDWQGFSIGAGNTVQFNNGTGATLNRVTGGQLSTILGSLNATGTLYLVNPQGVVVGAGGVVTTGGDFVASTLDIANDHFMAGGSLLFKGEDGGEVHNLGKISSTGGNVVLIAREVTNDGTITAANGTAALAGGTEVLLSDGGTVVRVVGEGSFDNGGTIAAAEAQLKAAGGNIFALAGNTDGVIRATGTTTRAGRVWLSAGTGTLATGGAVTATDADGSGGTVTAQATAGMVMHTGTLSADGTTGGSVSVTGDRVVNQGAISADGRTGRGGAATVEAGARYIATTGSTVSATGATDGGTVSVTADGTLFSSGKHQATGGAGKGGKVDLLAEESVTLVAASVDASGATAGGSVRIGGDFQGQGDVARAETVTITPETTVKADARIKGDGGRVIVWSDETTDYYGSISARGGAMGGDGGFIEVSAKGDLLFAGHADAGAAKGAAGTLLLDPRNITIGDAAAFPYYELIDPAAAAGNGFGSDIRVLTSGNVVISSPGDDTAATNAGAVHLFNLKTGALISTLTGATAEERLGRDIQILASGDFIVANAQWNQQRGSVTWGSAVTGVSGVVSAANSLVGSDQFDMVGAVGLVALPNGNVVVRSVNWNAGRGAVTLLSADAPVVGEISAANSLVGTTGGVVQPWGQIDGGDKVGGAVTLLKNGSFVVHAPLWNGQRGAVVWSDGVTALSGEISAATALVGTAVNDRIGDRIATLENGSFVTYSQYWNGSRGAATWGSGTAATVGEVSAANSLVGSTANDRVGQAVIALPNGSFVVQSPVWNGQSGAVTWGSGTAPLAGEISAANSLVGNTWDRVGNGGIQGLADGSYLVLTPGWSNARGAVTWSAGTAPLTGQISALNSLVGAIDLAQIGAGGVRQLSDGSLVVVSPYWNQLRGAVTWKASAADLVGEASEANSLVGTSLGDNVGLYGIEELSDGRVAVYSPSWYGTRGAITVASTDQLVGAVSSANSFVGTYVGDSVGDDRLYKLPNGAVVVKTYKWNSSRGAVTWFAPSAAVAGEISAANSLVGTTSGDVIGVALTVLANGNFVTWSPAWNGNRGAVTWGSAETGVAGEVSAANSLVGTRTDDEVGSEGVKTLANGSFVALSSYWNELRGAATWGSGTEALAGEVSAANSLVGTHGGVVNVWLNLVGGDRVGSNVNLLANGGFVLRTTTWNGNRGAVTWGSGTEALTGEISAANSLVGTTGGTLTDWGYQGGDMIGGVVTALSNGNFVVTSSDWNDRRGAVTWGSGSAALTGEISAANSMIGVNPGDGFGGDQVVTETAEGDYLIDTWSWNLERGAVTWGSGSAPLTGTVSAANSVLGRDAEGYLESHMSGDGIFIAYTSSYAGQVYVGITDPSRVTFDRAAGVDLDLAPSYLTRVLDTGTAVTLQASNDITLNSDIIVNNANGIGGALTLQAGRSLLLNASIVTDGGDLTLIANELLANGVVDAHRGAGAAVIAMGAGATIDAGTGTVSITLRDGAGKTNSAGGDVTLGAVTAGAVVVANEAAEGGDIVLNGDLVASGLGNAIVLAADGGGDLVNNAGADALTATNGRWLAYTADPRGNTLGGLTAANYYGVTRAGTAPELVGGSDNRFLHSVVPTLTVTAADVTKVYGAAVPALTYSVSGLIGGDSATDVLSGDLASATASSDVGTYDILAGTLTDHRGYAITYAPGTLTVTKATLTVTANDASRTYGAANPAFAATYSGFVLGQDASVLGGTLNLASAAQDADVGTYAITASGLTSGNYAITTVDGTLTVEKAALTVTAHDATRTYGAANPALAATYTGFVLGQDASVLGGSLATTATEASDVGTYVITASGLTSGNYAITTVDGTMTVEKAALTVTANDASRTYGAANPAFAATYSGFVLGQDAGVLGGTLSLASAAQDADVGTYAITASGLTSGNYAITYADGALTVTPAALTVTVDDASRVEGSANPDFTAGYSGFVLGQDASVLGGVLELASADETAVPGVYDIVGSGLVSTNYTITYVPGALTITARPPATVSPQIQSAADNPPAPPPVPRPRPSGQSANPPPGAFTQGLERAFDAGGFQVIYRQSGPRSEEEEHRGLGGHSTFAEIMNEIPGTPGDDNEEGAR